MSVLESQNLAIGYRAPLATEISVTLNAGELVCLLGPNGVGKSTLLRTLAGMQPPLAGRVLLGGVDVKALNPHERARRLSLVLTERVDVGLLTVESLVGLGRHPYTDWQGRLTPEDHAVIRWAIEAVGAVALAERHVSELSDGERQKVMIARALAQEPSVMILDEPTAFLDLPRRVEILQTLRRLSRETGRAILLSTHDLDMALRHADKIWLLSTSMQVGAPEDLVLSGAIENAFKGDGVRFDLQAGAFLPNVHVSRRVRLLGDNIAVHWTERALERAGFGITLNGDSAARIEVIAQGDGYIWRIERDGQVQQCASIESMIAYLK